MPVTRGAWKGIFSYAPGSPALGATTAVHAAVTDNGSPQVVTTAITSPAIPRNVTATAGGTGANITAAQVIVAGTDMKGRAISETLPAFTAATPGTVVGSKAFKTVTTITVPANGAGVTTAVGAGAKLGINAKLPRNTVLAAYLNGVKEGTAPTVAFDATNTSGNTVTLNSALNATAVVIDFYN